MTLPGAFLRMLVQAVGTERADAVTAAISCPPSVSVRLNPYKMSDAVLAGLPACFQNGISGDIAWSPYGKILPERPSFTLDPLFHSGAYYVQDSSAMYVGHVFRRQIAEFRECGRTIRVLDLCAAPGGKTTDLAASLRRVFGDDFLLVANEVVVSRASELRDNVSIWGDPCVVVTSSDPSAFANIPDFFDIIVADVPCSGEGMFRKDDGALRMWSEDNVGLCSARQRRILRDVWPALRPGGILVYSTCTFNDEENRNNVRWAASQFSADIVPPDADFSDGPYYADEGVYLLPGKVPGEGQYCAVLHKSEISSAPEASLRYDKSPSKGRRPMWKKASVPEGMFDAEMFGAENPSGEVIAYPSSVYHNLENLAHLKILKAGVPVGKVLKGRLVPDGDLVHSIVYHRGHLPEYEISKDLALSFLRRQSVPPSDMPHGFVVLTYSGLPVGIVNNIGTRTNNLLPKSRRIMI